MCHHHPLWLGAVAHEPHLQVLDAGPDGWCYVQWGVTPRALDDLPQQLIGKLPTTTVIHGQQSLWWGDCSDRL